MAGYVCWVNTFLSSNQCFGCHRRVCHRSCSFRNKAKHVDSRVVNRRQSDLIQLIWFRVWQNWNPEGKFLLTGSYDHSLGSFGINWQSVWIKPCVDANIRKNAVSLNRWQNVRFFRFFSTVLTHFNESDHCIRQSRDASGGVFTVSLGTSADFCYDWETDKMHNVEKNDQTITDEPDLFWTHLKDPILHIFSHL